MVKLLGRGEVRAEAITTNGSAYDFQPDWTFLSEVGTYDTGPVVINADGKNLIR
jgi:hypothetical protein